MTMPAPTTPLPPGIATTILTGRYIDPEGNPLQGTLTFSPPSVLTLPGALTISALPASVNLDQNGQFSVALISTDNSGMSPTGWTYQVTERIQGPASTTVGAAQPASAPVRQYNIFLPQNPSTVDISKLAPTSPNSGQYIPVVGPTGPPGPQGPAGAPAPPAGPASGDLTGAYPAPVVARVNGVAVSGSPAPGQVLTASSSTIAGWVTPGGDPPGGSAGGDLGGVYPNPSVLRVNGVGVSGTPAAGQVPVAVSSSAAVWSQIPTAPPSGAAGGDLSGTFPNPGVAKIAGVAVSGTPASGQVLTASGASGAAWSPLPAGSTASAGVLQLDGNAADIAALGVVAAGATGKAADAGHTHAMPRLDQVGAPLSAVNHNGQKVTNLANGVAATDAAAFGQIPVVGAAGAGSGVALSSTDPSVTNSRTPAGTAGGDLSGTFPSPSVAKLSGVAISGTPAANQVLAATSSTAAHWQAIGRPLKSGWWYPNAGGGGGSMNQVFQMAWVVPVDVERAVSITQLAINVKTASTAADSVIRLGIYASDGAGYIGNLIVDAGTVAANSTGVKTVTFAGGQSAGPDRLWFLAAWQGTTSNPSTVPALGSYTGVLPGVGAPSGFDQFPPIVAYQFTGISGSLPLNLPATPTGLENNQAPSMQFTIA